MLILKKLIMEIFRENEEMTVRQLRREIRIRGGDVDGIRKLSRSDAVLDVVWDLIDIGFIELTLNLKMRVKK